MAFTWSARGLCQNNQATSACCEACAVRRMHCHHLRRRMCSTSMKNLGLDQRHSRKASSRLRSKVYPLSGLTPTVPSPATYRRVQERLEPYTAKEASELMKRNAQRVVEHLKPGEKATLNVDGSYQSQRNSTNGSVTITARITDDTTGPTGRDIIVC